MNTLLKVCQGFILPNIEQSVRIHPYLEQINYRSRLRQVQETTEHHTQQYFTTLHSNNSVKDGKNAKNFLERSTDPNIVLQQHLNRQRTLGQNNNVPTPQSHS